MPRILRFVRDHWDALYLETINDLSERVNAPTAYGILRSSLILRQLLADGESLVARCNRAEGRRLKLRFEAIPFVPLPPELPQPVFGYTNPWPAPDLPSRHMVRSFDVDGLLAMPVMAFESEILTAKDILDHCAYALGGIHVGKKLSAADALLQQIDMFQQRLPAELYASPPLLVLLGLGMVALKGVQPLTDVVRTTD